MTYPREIEYFIAIVREGSISKASDKLCISQPALSKYLSKIENDVGSQLIIRNGSSLELTPSGKVYYDAAVAAYNIMTTASKQIDDFKDKGPIQLKLGVPAIQTQNSVALFTPELFKKYPNLTFSIIEAAPIELQRLLLHNDIDLAIMGYTDEDPELDCVKLYQTEMQLAVNENHPLAKKNLDVIDIHEVVNEKFVLPRYPNVFRQLIDKYQKEQNFTITPTIETRGKNAALLYVQAGTCIGFFQKDYGTKLGRIKYISLAVPTYHKVGIFHKKGEFLNSVAKEFTNLAIEFYKTPKASE